MCVSQISVIILFHFPSLFDVACIGFVTCSAIRRMTLRASSRSTSITTRTQLPPQSAAKEVSGGDKTGKGSLHLKTTICYVGERSEGVSPPLLVW